MVIVWMGFSLFLWLSDWKRLVYFFDIYLTLRMNVHLNFWDARMMTPFEWGFRFV